MNIILIIFGKLISSFFRLFNIGNGSTWPGHIALTLNPAFIKSTLSKSDTQVIIVAGTNGKTTTSALIKSSLEKNGKKVFQNQSGANLLNGIASSIILNSNVLGRLSFDYAIFEIDENNLPLILQEIQPEYIVILNLFRDQLDRYGEINTVAAKWKEAIDKLSEKTTLILNADDPLIANLAQNTHAKSKFFGISELSDQNIQHAADSSFCPGCGKKLVYANIIFSHLGDWHCGNCNLKRPRLDLDNFPIYPLPGAYNQYNTLAAVLTLKQIGMNDKEIKDSFTGFQPVFGRQEIIAYKKKKVQLFLSKNPTSFNQSFQAISELNAKTLLIVLNDRIPDGRDISWIWDIDLPNIDRFESILVSGDRLYDMALRLKYELGIANYEFKVKAFENLKTAIDFGIEKLDAHQTLFILPTYSGMLESRKILTGRKIL